MVYLYDMENENLEVQLSSLWDYYIVADSAGRVQ